MAKLTGLTNAVVKRLKGLVASLKLINNPEDVSQLSKMLTHEEPEVQEATVKKLREPKEEKEVKSSPVSVVGLSGGTMADLKPSGAAWSLGVNTTHKNSPTSVFGAHSFVMLSEPEIMKVKVDADLCTGCELCIDVCTDVFEIKDDVSVVKVDVVPENLEDDVREATEDCPTEAIIVELAAASKKLKEFEDKKSKEKAPTNSRFDIIDIPDEEKGDKK